MAAPCRVIVSEQLAKVLNLEPNQDLSYREWVQILHDGGLDTLTEKAFLAIEEAKKEEKGKTTEEKEQKSLNEPRTARDVAFIFRKLFNFNPMESVMAARLFDAKASFMAMIKGISKEDYYKQYWFGGELSDRGKALYQIVGENAQLAQDVRDNLQVARDMESAGKDAKTIRIATGWEKGKDGKWRYEISPITVKDLKPNTSIFDTYFNRLKIGMPYGKNNLLNILGSESELIKMYPKLGDVKVVTNTISEKLLGNESGSYDPSTNTITINYYSNYQYQGNEGVSTFVHEIQHAIQNIEGFAKGGNELTIAAEVKSIEEKLKNVRKLRDAWQNAKSGTKQAKIALDEYNKAMDEIDWKKYNQLVKYLPKNLQRDMLSAFEGYKALAGEVEARNVEKRIGMTPEQRRATTLQETEDVARDEQIVLFEQGLGQESNQDRKGAWSKEAAKAKRFISMYKNADSTTQVHEVLGHDYLDEIISASETNEQFANDLNTIVDEYIKAKGSKVKKETLLNDLKNFDVEKNKNQNGIDIHEWFAESAEMYLATERGVKTETTFGKKMAAIFNRFREHLANIYAMMSKELVEPSPAMKEIFRKVFGADNFAEAEEMRQATTERMTDLSAAELEKNKKKVSLEDILNKYKPKEGLGQLSEEFKQDMYNLASMLVEDGMAQRYNVTDKLQDLLPHLKNDIEQLRKELQKVGTKGTLRSGVENLLANPHILPEIKEQLQKLGEYTPEKMLAVGLKAEHILSFYQGEKGGVLEGMQEVASLLDQKDSPFANTTEKVALRQLLIANYNQLAKVATTEQAKQEYIEKAVDQAEKLMTEGTGLGRMVNMYKALNRLSSDGLIYWAKKQQRNYLNPKYEALKSEIADLKKQLKKAYEDIDYFLEQVVGREETEEQYREAISEYQQEIDRLKARKPREPKTSKPAYKSVRKERKFQVQEGDFANLAKDILDNKLFQSMDNLTPAQKLAYGIMERKPANISEFAKQFSKYLGKKVDPSELRELYQQTRDLLITEDIGFAEGLSSNEELERDLKGLEDTNKARIEELERKKADAEAKLAEKKAMKTQMSEKDKEVQAKEALKQRQKEIRDSFLNSLSQEGLWQQYVKSAAGRLLSNLNSKIGGSQNEKALLDEFTQLATREISKAIDELTPKKKGAQKQESNYPQQLADLISNQEKLADIFDKAIADFAEKNKGNVNAQSVISKLYGLKNPFSEKLLENALEREAKNYNLKIGDLAFNYAGLKEQLLKDQIINKIVADTGLTGQQAAQLKQDLQNKLDSIVAQAEKNTAGKLSDFIISDLKKAMNGSLPKQKTYVEELLSALTKKAKEVALKGEKGETTKTQLSPIDAIKQALQAIEEGRPDANIWNDAVEEVKRKIAEDNTLSQKDKEDLNLYLNDYTNFVYDNMLNDSVIYKAIKENLIANGYGTGNTPNFRALIVEGGKAEMFERQRLIEKLKNDLSQYPPAQVEKILDIVAERYQKLINEKRKDIANAYIDKLIKGALPKTRKAIRGKVGQLLMENRMGLFDETNNQILDVIAENKGLTGMKTEDWVKLKEYADTVENLPEGNLKNEALEELVAFVRTKMPSRAIQLAMAIRYSTLLGRPTSQLKNFLGGIFESLPLAGGRALRGDTEFFKAAMRGFRQGDFKDILFGGGINQASRVSVEADNNGMPHFRILEYINPSNLFGKFIATGKYTGRALDAMDAIWQKYFTSGYDIKYMRKLYQLQNPNATKAEIDAMIKELLSKERYDDYYAQGLEDVTKAVTLAQKARRKAVKDVIATGKKVTKAKVKRRTYEIMREALIDPIVRDLADFESMEKTYKTDFLQNKGIATLAGKYALGLANISKQVVEPLVETIYTARGFNEKYAKEQAKIYGSILPNFALPFSKGLAGFIEKGFEKELVYGLAKSIIVAAKASRQKPTTVEEKLAQARAFEKAKDIASTAVFTNLILYGVGSILFALSKQWDDDEEKEGRFHPKTGLYGAAEKIPLGQKSTVAEKAQPENSVVLFGREIPLSYLGGLGVAAMIDANVKKAFDKKVESKKTKEGDETGAFIDAAYRITDSFLSQSYLLQTSENQDINELIRNGNTEKALEVIENSMINYGGSYILWSGFLNQSLQGARAAMGGDTYQEAKTTSEKIQKQFGLAGITYQNTKKNYLGEDILYADVNREGIVALVNIGKVKSMTAEDNWLRKIGYKENIKGQYNKELADVDGYSPSVQEFDNYTDRNKIMFGKFAKEAYKERNNIVPDPEEENKKTKKPYTQDEWQTKVMSTAANAIAKYNLVRFKNDRGDYNSDPELYEEELEEAIDKLDSAFYDIYYRKNIPYKQVQQRIDNAIEEITNIK